MLKSKTSRLVSLLVAIVMAFGLGLSGAKNLFASAATADVTDTLTFNAGNEYSTQFTVPTGTNGQYMITLDVTTPTITSEETYNSISFTATIDIEGRPYSEYFSYNSVLGAYYAIMDVRAGDVIVFNAYYDRTSGELEGVTELDVSLTIGGLQIGPFSGNALYNIVLPADVTLNGVAAGNYYIAVSSADFERDIPADATLTVKHGTSTTTLVNNADMGGYYALLTLSGNETLTIASSVEDIPSVNIELRKETTAVPFNGEVSLHAQESAVYSFSVTNSGFYELKQGESTYTTETGETVEATALYGFILKSDPNYVVGDFIDVDQPLYLLGGRTYYLDVTCGSASADVTNEDGESVPVENPLVTTKFTVSAWAGATLTEDGVTNTPVYAEGSENIVPLTASLYAGDYTVALIDVPDDVTSVTVHFGNQTLVLTSAEGFQTEKFTLNSATTSVWLTSSTNFVTGLFVGRIVPEDSITVNATRKFTLSAGGRLLCYVESGTEDPLAVGTYLITMDDNKSISVLTPTGDYAANAGATFGLFEIDQYSGSGYYLVFENLTEAEASVTVTITLETHLLKLNTPTEIALTDGEALYYVQHVYGGDYILTVSVPTGYTVDIYGVGDDFEGVVGEKELTFTIDLHDEEGVELLYTNLAIAFYEANSRDCTITVTLTAVEPEPEVTE